MHHIGKYDDSALTAVATYAGHNQGYREAPLVNHTHGSVHTGLSITEIAGGGSLAPHVHSYEESFYLLEGEVTARIGERNLLLKTGDYGVIKVGTPHAWHNRSAKPARWLHMCAPQPKADGHTRDTYFLKDSRLPGHGVPLDAASIVPGTLLGRFDISQVPPPSERKGALAGTEGVYLNWLIDAKFGAAHHRMAFIEYQPGIGIGLHDHTFEESYFILSGEVEATLDGEPYVAKAGDFAWTGVGCVHSFHNRSSKPVWWLETFSPQPPPENAFRFMGEWDRRAQEIEG